MASVKTDAFGNVLSLRQDGDVSKAGGPYITAQQLAECVKVVQLKLVYDEDGDLDDVIQVPYTGEIKGKKFNMIGGATGTGKTSAIKIFAGGFKTDPKMHSDTKAPALYVVIRGDAIYGFLDTAGLCDTAAEGSNDADLQELLINAVAATVQRFNIEIVRNFITVDMGGRLPTRFGDCWPGFRNALGGSELDSRGIMLVTKANIKDVEDKKLLKKAQQDDNPKSFHKVLNANPLGWPLVYMGTGNLEGFQSVLCTLDSTETGVGSNAVDSSVESLDRKRKIADTLQTQLRNVKAAKQNLDPTKLQDSIDQTTATLNQAKVDLASLGACEDTKKTRYRGMIENFEKELKLLRSTRATTKDELKAKEQEVDNLNDKLQAKMEEVRRDEGIGAFWKSLGTAAGTVIAKVVTKPIE